MTHRAAFTLLAPIALAAGGCFSTSQPTQTGIRIGDETLKQFKAGVTTEDWLVAVIGPPTTQSTLKSIPNTKVFRYAMGQSAGGLGALFSGEASKNTAVVYFVITDGIVTRFWADRETETRLFGDPVEKPGGEKAGGK
ncbi:MAG: hypothetical protein K2Q09_05805 [Phycisphaerales bacterium]|nr:hypothetical protein [Phycisphaerales bacterium]